MANQPKRFKRDFDFNAAPVNKRGQFNYEAENDNNDIGKAFVAKTKAQEELAVLIKNNDVSFGIGPAGTGKTHVAVALAAEAETR
jgi:phosphate starvation-inducible PhoH-like protein